MHNTSFIARFSVFLVVIFLFTSCGTRKNAENLPNAGLKVPDGFAAKILADSLGKARHLAVTPKGDIYVRLANPIDGRGTLLLSESNGAMVVKSGFGDFGGTGISIKDGYLYASSNEEIFRYKLDDQYQVIDSEQQIGRAHV